jgi:hypothetical protein
MVDRCRSANAPAAERELPMPVRASPVRRARARAEQPRLPRGGDRGGRNQVDRAADQALPESIAASAMSEGRSARGARPDLPWLSGEGGHGVVAELVDGGPLVAHSDHAVHGLAQVRAARRDRPQPHGAGPTGGELAAATGFTPGRSTGCWRRADAACLRGAAELGGGHHSAWGDDRRRGPGGSTEPVLDGMELQDVRDLADRLERERTVAFGRRRVTRRSRSAAAVVR